MPTVLLSSVLAFATLLASPAPAAAEGNVLSRYPSLGSQEKFSYKVEDGAVVGWADPAFPKLDLLGAEVYLPDPAADPDAEEEPALVPRTQALRVGPRRPGEDASWMEKLEISTSITASEKPRCLDVTVKVRNTTPELIAFRKNPLVISLGPLGAPQRTSRDYTTFKAMVGETLQDVSADAPIDEDARWIADLTGFRVYVLELLEGPGRFQVESQSFYADGKREVQVAGHWIRLRPVKEIHGNERFTVKLRLFAGLKKEDVMQAAGYGEAFDVWSGFTGPIGRVMFWFLKLFYRLTESWGLAIVLLTLFVKLLLHPISRKQYESMAKMQKIQPEIQRIQVKYQNNQQRAQEEIQKLMVESGANPLLGCLPLLLQIPIFFALYSCLSSAPELRGASFLWLTDLSAPDPYLILPVLFSAGIYFSASQGAQDPNSKMMMQIMPVMMFVFMINIASGVMIYLAGQTVLGFFEQRAHRSQGAAPGAGPGEGEGGDDAPVVVENEPSKADKPTGNKYKQARKKKK